MREAILLPGFNWGNGGINSRGSAFWMILVYLFDIFEAMKGGCLLAASLDNFERNEPKPLQGIKGI